MLNIKIIKDKNEWEKVLSDFKIKDIFYTYEFIEANCIIEGGFPEAILWEGENGKVFYPYIKRPLYNLEYVPDKYREYFDITSPYGAGGVIFEGDTRGFLNDLRDFFIDEKIICEFIRFHPLIENHKIFEKDYKIIEVSPIVYIDLRKFKNEKEILKGFRKGHKADIKYAIKKEYLIKKNKEKEWIKKFYDFFIKTMKRVGSDKRHFFPLEFFIKLSRIKGVNFYYVLFEGNILCCAIFLKFYPFGTYFLSASNILKRGGTHFMLWNFMEEIYKERFEFFCLGGGLSKGNDSLLHFKLGFSKNMKPYFISRKIYFKEIYDELTKEFMKYKSLKEKPSLFPQYRDI